MPEEVIKYVRVLAKEFDEVPVEEIEILYEMVEPLVDKEKFGKLYNQALALLICHKLKMAGQGESVMGGMGSIANGLTVGSISDGGTSISFSGNAQGDGSAEAEYALTVYGMQYVSLRKLVIVPILINTGAV